METARRDFRTPLSVTAAVLVPVVWVAHFAGMSGFTFDDFRNFRDAQLQGLTIRHLLDPVGGFYFSPGHRFVNWVMQAFFPMSFTAAQVFTVVTLGLSLYVFYKILVEVSGRWLGAQVLTMLYGLSVVQVAVSQWWTSSLQVHPATLCSFLCILCYLRFFRTGRRALLVVSIMALVIGMLFHSKTAIVPLYLVLLRVLLLQPDARIPTIVTGAVREWRVWLAYLVPVAGVMAVFLAKWGRTDPSLQSLVDYLSVLWLRVFVPGLFGGALPPSAPVPGLSPDVVPLSSSSVAVLAFQAAFVGAVGWAVVRVPGAWRAVVVFAVAFLVNAIPIGLTRIFPPIFSAEVTAYALRHNVEATYVFFICVAVVLSRSPTPSGGLSLVVMRAAPAVGVLGVVLMAWFGARMYSGPAWLGRPAASYVENVQDSLRTVAYSPGRSAFVDGVVPEFVVLSVLAPANTVSEVLPVIDDRVVFDVDGHDLLTVEADGKVRPVLFRGRDGGDPRYLEDRGSLIVLGTTMVAQREDGLCIKSSDGPAVVSFTPLVPVGEGSLYLALRYSSAARRPVVLGVESPEGGFSSQQPMLLKDGEEQTNLFPLQGQTLMRLYVTLVPDSDVCFQRLEVGQLSQRP